MRKLACTAALTLIACGSEPLATAPAAAPLTIEIADITHHLEGTAIDVDVLGTTKSEAIEGEVWISLLVEHEGAPLFQSGVQEAPGGLVADDGAPRWLERTPLMREGRTERFLIPFELPEGATIQACVRHRPAREVTDVVCALEIR